MSGVEDDVPASAAAAAAPAPTAGAGAPATSSDADADVELQHASQVSQVYGNRQKRLDKGLNFLSGNGYKHAIFTCDDKSTRPIFRRHGVGDTLPTS